MEISFKSHNKKPKLNNFEEEKKTYNPKIVSVPFPNNFQNSQIKQVNPQFENIFDGFSSFQKSKNLNIKNNKISNLNNDIGIKKDHWKNRKKLRKKSEKKNKIFENINEKLIDTSIDVINQNNYNEFNVLNTKKIFSNSKSVSLTKEDESEDTTSFDSDNNLSIKLTNSYNINSVEKIEKNQNFYINKSNDLYENYEYYLKNIDKQNYFKYELNLENNYNNVVFFPNDFKRGKKKNKKKKKKNNLINNNNINIINNYYVDIGNNINNIIKVPNHLINPNNYIISNLNSNINNYNYNSNSNINYNNIEKTNKKSNIILSNQNLIKKKNVFKIKKDNSHYFNENKLGENIEQKISEPFLNENIDKKEEKVKENKRKYIYMSDILACPPIKINQSSKPFIINEQYKKPEILLNIKIKIPNSNNFIEIPLREDENPYLIFNNLKLNSTDEIKKIIYEKIEYSIYLIKYFKNLALSRYSVNQINELFKI